MPTKLAFIVAGVMACGCSQRPLDLPGGIAVADLGAADLAISSTPAFDLETGSAPPDAAPADLATSLPTGDLAFASHADMARAATGDMATTLVCGRGLLLPSVPLVPTPNSLSTVTRADLDGDGNLDLLASGGFALDISFGNGDGTFKPVVQYGAGGPHLQADSVTTDDFNGDGKPDIVVVDTNTLVVALNKGDGTFDPSLFAWGKGIPTGGLSQATTGDFNHDGKRDIAGAGGDHIAVLLGNGDGTFMPIVSYPTGQALSTVLVGDLDGDGNVDLVGVMQAVYSVSSSASGDLGVLLGKGDGTFGAVVHYGVPSTGGSGFGALGDVNNDGKLDVLASNYQSNLMSVFLGNGDGTLQAPTTLAANSVAHNDFDSDYVGAIDVADFNGDGKLDVATTEPWSNLEDYDNFVNVLLGNGDGTFQAAVRVTTGSAPWGLTTGDFDGDGKLDLVTADWHSGLGVVLGTGDGTFRGPGRVSVGGELSRITSGDFNGDDILDLALTDLTNGGTARILLGSGNGQFTVAGSYPTGEWPRDIATADLDHDGKLDLVVTRPQPTSPSPASDPASVLLGNGDGSFAAPVDYAVGGSPSALAIADLDGNGLPDVITADYGTQTVSVLLGGGKGAFAPSVQYATSNETTGVFVGDFNRDGKLDIAATGLDTTAQAYTVVLFLGRGDGTFAKAVLVDDVAGIVSADFNGDGNLDIAAEANAGYGAGGLVVLLGKGNGTFVRSAVSGGASCGSIGDVNGDGKLDCIAGEDDAVGVSLGNGDGTFQPESDYVGPWRNSGITTGDFDRDGKLDIATVANGEAVGDGEVSVLLNRGCH